MKLGWRGLDRLGHHVNTGRPTVGSVRFFHGNWDRCLCVRIGGHHYFTVTHITSIWGEFNSSFSPYSLIAQLVGLGCFL